MSKILQKLFTSSTSIAAGIVTTAVLFFLILQEESVQPYRNHRWIKEAVTQPLTQAHVFSQELIIPDSLSESAFMIALFFGGQGVDSKGVVEVSLAQGAIIQTHRVEVAAPSPTLRKQFRFDGYSAGLAELVVKGIDGNSDNAPGLLYITEGEGAQLHGPGLKGPVYASVAWFKIYTGSGKFTRTFPNILTGIAWVLPFAGLMALAIAGMGKEPGDTGTT